jgi:hypothetical protein
MIELKERLVTQKQASQMAGVKPASISSLKLSGRWGFFVGTKININHPSWFAYLKTRGINPFGVRIADEGINETDENDEDLENVLAEESDAIIRWKIARAEYTEEKVKKAILEREKYQGSLIPIDFVETIIGDYIGLLHKRFLDMPQDTIDRILQILESKNENSRQLVIETMIHEIEMNLKQTKKEIVRAIDKYKREIEK